MRRNQTGPDRGAPVGVRLNSGRVNVNGTYEPPVDDESARTGVRVVHTPLNVALAGVHVNISIDVLAVTVNNVFTDTLLGEVPRGQAPRHSTRQRVNCSDPRQKKR